MCLKRIDCIRKKPVYNVTVNVFLSLYQTIHKSFKNTVILYTTLVEKIKYLSSVFSYSYVLHQSLEWHLSVKFKDFSTKENRAENGDHLFPDNHLVPFSTYLTKQMARGCYSVFEWEVGVIATAVAGLFKSKEAQKNSSKVSSSRFQIRATQQLLHSSSG